MIVEELIDQFNNWVSGFNWASIWGNIQDALISIATSPPILIALGVFFAVWLAFTIIKEAIADVFALRRFRRELKTAGKFEHLKKDVTYGAKTVNGFEAYYKAVGSYRKRQHNGLEGTGKTLTAVAIKTRKIEDRLDWNNKHKRERQALYPDQIALEEYLLKRELNPYLYANTYTSNSHIIDFDGNRNQDAITAIFGERQILDGSQILLDDASKEKALSKLDHSQRAKASKKAKYEELKTNMKESRKRFNGEIDITEQKPNNYVITLNDAGEFVQIYYTRAVEKLPTYAKIIRFFKVVKNLKYKKHDRSTDLKYYTNKKRIYKDIDKKYKTINVTCYFMGKKHKFGVRLAEQYGYNTRDTRKQYLNQFTKTGNRKPPIKPKTTTVKKVDVKS